MALLLNLSDDLIAVLVTVVEGTQDDRIDMAANQIGTDRFFAGIF